jgi:hypothetical protein
LKIVVNHLTRMQPGYICIAGLDLQTNEHVRPVLRAARLAVNLLRRNGGVFDMATVVDLGPTKGCGKVPEIEDHIFEPHRLFAVKDLDAVPFWKLLKSVSCRNLADIFGQDLKPQRSGCAVGEGMGNVSLGCLRLAESPKIFVNQWRKVRMRVSDGRFDVDLSVTDLRLYESDQRTPRSTAVAEVQRRIEQGVGVILSVGLARAFTAQGDTERRHWLQVNNIHLEDAPTWKCT